MAWPPSRRRCVCRDAPSQEVQPGGECVALLGPTQGRSWCRRHCVPAARTPMAECSSMSAPMQRLVTMSEAAIEARGRAQAAGEASLARTDNRARSGVRCASSHDAFCFRLLKYALSWARSKPVSASGVVSIPPSSEVPVSRYAVKRRPRHRPRRKGAPAHNCAPAASASRVSTPSRALTRDINRALARLFPSASGPAPPAATRQQRAPSFGRPLVPEHAWKAFRGVALWGAGGGRVGFAGGGLF